MNQSAFRYFEDLKANGAIEKVCNIEKNKNEVQLKEVGGYVLSKCSIKGDPLQYYIKKADIHRGVSAAVSSDMYNKVGILTPPIYVLNKTKYSMVETIQQDVSSICGIDAVLAGAVKNFSNIQYAAWGKFKWQVFYNSGLEDYFLKYMTPGCYEQMKAVFLADELRTDIDRHVKNFFFYKKAGDYKFSGIIAIDLDEMKIYDYCGTAKGDFENFLYMPYSSMTPQQNMDYISYIERMRDMRELLDDGVVSEDNVEMLKSMLEYDFPKNIKQTCHDKKISIRDTQKITIPIERLWEYNRNTLGKDLGL